MTTLQTTYVLLAAGFILLWLAFAALEPRKVEAPNAGAVLRYGVVLRILALVLALGPPLVMAYMVWAFPRRDAMVHLTGLSSLATSVFGGLLLLEVNARANHGKRQGLTRSSPWTSPLTLKWADVENVHYSAVNRWFVVASAGQTIRVSRYLGGIGAFVAAVRQHVPAERCASAAAMLDALQ